MAIAMKWAFGFAVVFLLFTWCVCGMFRAVRSEPAGGGSYRTAPVNEVEDDDAADEEEAPEVEVKQRKKEKKENKRRDKEKRHKRREERVAA